MAQTILTGANLVVYINRVPWGVVETFMFDPQTPSDEIRGIDSPEVQELAPTISGISGRATIWRQASDGGLEGAGLAVHSQRLARGRYFSMQVIDRVTGQTYFSCVGARVNSQSWGAEVKRMIRGTFTWSALRWSNELTNER